MTRVLFAGGQVFDGTGSPPVPADVVVENGRILAVGSGLSGDERVECAGRTLIPGLFDCHVHLITGPHDPMAGLSEPFSLQFFRAMQNMRASLATGITSVRDACGADLGIKVAQETGVISGPRVQLSIMQICQTGGHADFWHASGCCPTGVFTPHPGRPDGVADGSDAVRAKVRELVRAGADVIKISTSGGVFSPRSNPHRGYFRDAEVAVIVEEATAAGIAVMSHAYAAEGIKTAVRNGVRSIEHGDFIDDEAIDLMLEHKTWLVPTLMAWQGAVEAGESGHPLPEHIMRKNRELMQRGTEAVSRAVAAGVRVAFGTDTGVTAHGRNLEEFQYLLECGMSAPQALHAATLSAAELMGVDEHLGSIHPGKIADLVLIDGDALDLGTLATRIRAVYQDGRLVHSSDR